MKPINIEYNILQCKNDGRGVDFYNLFSNEKVKSSVHECIAEYYQDYNQNKLIKSIEDIIMDFFFGNADYKLHIAEPFWIWADKIHQTDAYIQFTLNKELFFNDLLSQLKENTIE